MVGYSKIDKFKDVNVNVENNCKNAFAFEQKPNIRLVFDKLNE